ncbi:hypothetical protein [Marinicellulosiphila megalodicopiae]|uniref:hypothetical protein n=1 Tax=Marinicellulosiphila megalodicopiae TaxID=2724896 RepID=UPI003BAE5438
MTITSKTNDEVVLEALKKDLLFWTKKAEKCKAESEERDNVYTDLLNIHKEFTEIVQKKDYSEVTMNKLDKLKARKTVTDKILKKDSLKLNDNQFNAESQRDTLKSEINKIEFRMGLRNE